MTHFYCISQSDSLDLIFTLICTSDFESKTWPDTIEQLERLIYLNKVRSMDENIQKSYAVQVKKCGMNEL